MSKTDAFVRVFTRNTETGQLSFFGRTEIVWDSLCPKFQKKFDIPFNFADMTTL